MPRLPNGAKAPVKKKKPAPKRKPSTPIVNGKVAKKKPSSPKGSLLKSSTYQVPKNLMKNTAANRAAGPVREGQKLTAAEKKAYKQGTAELSAKAKAALKPKRTTATRNAKSKTPSSDWEKGMAVRDWARGQDWYKGRK